MKHSSAEPDRRTSATPGRRRGTHPRALLLVALVSGVLLFSSCARDGRGGGWRDLDADERELVEELLAAEDRRLADEGPVVDSALATFRRGLASSRAEIRRLAVRGLGRLENPDLSGEIAKVLHSEPAAEVRAEAANALAQAIFGAGPDAGRVVAGSLLAAFGEAEQPSARGAIAQALGRLSVPPELLPEIEAALVQAAEEDDAIAVLGAARGFESLTRRNAELALDEASRERLAELALGGDRSPQETAPEMVSERDSRIADADVVAARTRRLSIAALAAAGAASLELLQQTRADPDREVRRLAVRGLAAHAAALGPARIVQVAQDDDPAVRYQALGSLTPAMEATGACALAVLAIADESPHVALLGIDLAGERCESKPVPVELLQRMVSQLPAGETGEWHRAAHALLALAHLSPEMAAERLPAFVEHPVWQVRMYAARAAARLEDRGPLLALSEDAMPNVAEASLAALAALEDRDADAASLAALERDDYQLLLTAARSLAGTEHPEAIEALFRALDRVSAQQRETSRDIRREILQRIGELGGGGPASSASSSGDYVSRLEPLLRDFDPQIAGLAATILEDWTGEAASAEPQPLPRLPLPSFDELLELSAARVVLQLAHGTVELRLRPFDAPTNAARFARLAEQGYYDGLTFHRVVPNFVIQGGSPNANEFMGDGPFTRDELTGHSHLRSTVGLSTRGRDTGDAQIFVNLVDNVRLDHNYTIFAEVAAGMDVVDRVLEGATIESVRIEIP